MDASLLPADQADPADLHRAFGAAFSDYLIGPFQLSLAQWPLFTARQGVDLGLSRVAHQGGEVAAFALVAPRASGWRLGTMGAVPTARGSGLAARLLDDFVARAQAAGLPRVELECFAQNERAIRLYASRGFEAVSALYGYTMTSPASDAAVAPAPAVDLEDAWQWLDASGDLPLQVTPVSLRALPVALQAWRLGSAQLVFSRPAPGAVTLHSLVDRDAAQRDAEVLVQRLLQACPGERFTVPQLQLPRAGGEALERLGFERQPLHQQWMVRVS
jgi:ribosomal protein S18 acetylase RimI-like enzyme